MILISIKIFGMSLKTWHISLGFDLPVKHWSVSASIVTLEVSTGPLTVTAPAHSVQAVEVKAADVSHEPTHPNLDSWS